MFLNSTRRTIAIAITSAITTLSGTVAYRSFAADEPVRPRESRSDSNAPDNKAGQSKVPGNTNADAQSSDSSKGQITTKEQQMIREQMSQIKEMCKDPSSMNKCRDDMARAAVMHQLTLAIANDPEFQRSHEAAMKDSGVTKMLSECKANVANKDQMNQLREQIINDPQAFKQVMTHALLMDCMRKDPQLKQKIMGDSSTQDRKDTTRTYDRDGNRSSNPNETPGVNTPGQNRPGNNPTPGDANPTAPTPR